MAADELAFFGKIAAGVTHELKNVLAIINESSGLMTDLMAMSKDASFPMRDRFTRSIGKIEQQVRRGVEITSNFNRFAHSMDHPVVEADLNAVVALTVALSERFARLKNIRLSAIAEPEPVILSTQPFRLQMALTRAAEAVMQCLDGPGAISLQVQKGGGKPSVLISCETESGTLPDLPSLIRASSHWAELESLLDMLGASVEVAESGGAGSYRIVFA
ncbi:MAG: hypothetical protein LLG06_03170 [Desulfobacteraceae bacterium]|nr:hypothetical protein [Desulfobacteraceae bacterium]